MLQEQSDFSCQNDSDERSKLHQLPSLPAHVIAMHIGSFLDRQTFNAVRVSCQEVRQYLDVMDRSWPIIKIPINGMHGVQRKVGVQSLAFSADGRSLACRSRSGVIRVWDRHEGRKYQWSAKGAVCFGNIAFSPFDGNLLACDAKDKTIRLCEVSSGQCLKSLRGHHGPITSLCFSPANPEVLASCSTDSTVSLWDRSKPESDCLQAVLHGHSGTVYSIAFSPDGQCLASGGADAVLRVWDVNKVMANNHNQFCQDLTGHEMAIVSVAFASNHVVLSASLDMSIRMWSSHKNGRTGNMRYLRSFGLPCEALSMQLSSCGSQLSVGLANETVSVFNIAENNQNVTDDNPTMLVPGRLGACAPNVMVTTRKDGFLHLHDTTTCQ